MAPIDELTRAVKGLALQAGFGCVGIAPAGGVPDDCARRFRSWLAEGYHGRMTYMAAHLAERFGPGALLAGARSVICLAVGYAPAAAGDSPPGGPSALVARYARGRDYHKVLKKRCLRLMDRIREIEPGFAGRAFVDTAPVMERSLAAAAGVGWIGRNGCLVVPRLGSYVVLCEIICNLPLRAEAPLESQCRDCRACLEACPTGALVQAGIVDARRCISYLTIEHRGEIDPSVRPPMGLRVFGCDACQEACPFNQRVPPGDPELLGAGRPLGGASVADILSWSAGQWDAATRGSAARRATCDMFLRNAVIAAANSGDESLAPRLGDLAHSRPELRDLAAWALARLADAASP